MRKLLPLMLFCACTIICHAQTPSIKNNNAISFELGKTGLVYNITFDHRFKNTHIGFRATAGAILAKYVAASVFGGGAYYLVGKRNKFLEVGADVQRIHVEEISNDQRTVVFFYPDYTISTWYPSVNIGYRSYGKKSLFRIGFSPGIIEGKFIPGGYVSIGAAF
jgi:hypothetical protein